MSRRKKNFDDSQYEVESQEVAMYEFSEEELREISEGMAANYSEQVALEAEKKAVTAEYSGRIKEKKALIESLAIKINNKQEERQVACIVRMNTPDATNKTAFRKDNNEIVWVRPMTDDELQLKLYPETASNVSESTVEHSDVDDNNA